jgi:hypothetical protein
VCIIDLSTGRGKVHPDRAPTRPLGGGAFLLPQAYGWLTRRPAQRAEIVDDPFLRAGQAWDERGQADEDWGGGWGRGGGRGGGREEGEEEGEALATRELVGRALERLEELVEVTAHLVSRLRSQGQGGAAGQEEEARLRAIIARAHDRLRPRTEAEHHELLEKYSQQLVALVSHKLAGGANGK